MMNNLNYQPVFVRISREEYKALIEDSVLLKNLERVVSRKENKYFEIDEIKNLIGME